MTAIIVQGYKEVGTAQVTENQLARSAAVQWWTFREIQTLQLNKHFYTDTKGKHLYITCIWGYKTKKPTCR